MLANRLKKILPFIIFENQGAFVPRRQITDNVLIASELLNFLQQKTQGKKGSLSIKLDMNLIWVMPIIKWNGLFLKML